RVVAIYLLSIAVVSVAAGYTLDWVYRTWQLVPAVTFGRASGFVPEQVKVASALLLLALLARSLWRAPVPEEWSRLGNWLAPLTGVRLTAARLWVRTDRVRRIEVGFRGAGRRESAERGFGRQALTLAGPGFPVPPSGAASFWFHKEKVSDESFLLTGDANIIDIAFTVQYQVKDPLAFVYNVADGDALVRSVTIGALRARIATMTIDAIYATERDEVARRVVRDVQLTLDAYGTGIRMVAVSLLSVHAPEEVH